jgi:hypothetical protein
MNTEPKRLVVISAGNDLIVAKPVLLPNSR